MRQDKIISVLDNDCYKWEKRVGGTKWNINSPEILRDFDSPAVILPLGPYTQEIKKQILTRINNAVRLIEIESI